MKRSAPRITVTLLRQFNPCPEGLEAFREAFPRGLTVATTGPGRARQAARAASAGLDIGWAAETLLDAVARAAYREAIATAYAAYQEADAVAFLDAFHNQHNR